MKKIISLFKRDYGEGQRLVFDEVVPGAEWVVAGEGVATRKFDGTCCLIENGVLYKRYDAKHGKTPPTGFIPAQEADPITGHWPGWLEVLPDDPQSKWHLEAADRGLPKDGTYELCGPKIQSNPDRFDKHVFVKHGLIDLQDCPRTYNELMIYLTTANIEGIVWHHPDGRMVKIKTGDFGLKRNKGN